MTVGVVTSTGERFRLLDPILDRFGDDAPDAEAVPADPVAGPANTLPTATYAGIRWTIDEVRLIPAVETVNGRPIIVVEATVATTPAIGAGAGLRIRDRDVVLVWPDGRREAADRFEQVDDATSFTVDDGAAAPLTIVFKPPVTTDPDLDTLTIEIGESGRIPAVLPLGDAPSVPETPVAGRFEQARARFEVAGPGSADLVVSPRSVALGLDAGPYRAAVGERVVAVEVDVTVPPAAVAVPHHEGEFWGLATEGELAAPVRVIRQPAEVAPDPGADGATIEPLTLLFLIDAERDTATLVVGADTSAPVEFDIGFPPSGRP
ncbi:MAG: hypothetical protein AAF547_23545 [Actinomycetota bacterium]